MTRRHYLQALCLSFGSALLAACRKDLGRKPVHKKLQLSTSLPAKLYAGQTLTLSWISENIRTVTVRLKIGNSNWQDVADNIDANRATHTILLPANIPAPGQISISIAGEDLSSTLSNLKVHNVFMVDATLHRELTTIGGIKNFQFGSQDVFIKRSSASSITCFSSACTHSGCPISYLQSAGLFSCSCHGSQFDANGNVLQGPASAPLKTLVCETLGPELFRVLY